MALFGVNSVTLIIFSSLASDTDGRTKRLSRKKSWGSRLLKCCSVSSTLKAVRKTNSQSDLGYCSLLNCKFISTERSRHVWHSHSGPGVTGRIVTEVNLSTLRCVVPGCFFLTNTCLTVPPPPFLSIVPAWKKSWRTWRKPLCLKRSASRLCSRGCAGKPRLPGQSAAEIACSDLAYTAGAAAPKHNCYLIAFQ